jgi:hypothetical protein
MGTGTAAEDITNGSSSTEPLGSGKMSMTSSEFDEDVEPPPKHVRPNNFDDDDDDDDE